MLIDGQHAAVKIGTPGAGDDRPRSPPTPPRDGRGHSGLGDFDEVAALGRASRQMPVRSAQLHAAHDDCFKRMPTAI